MILDVGPGYNRGPSTNLKHCRRDDNCCAPAERAACAPGYRYSRGEPCDGDSRCGDHAVCCTRCLPGEACAEKSEDFGRAVRCGGRGTRFHWLPVTLVVALAAAGAAAAIAYARTYMRRPRPPRAFPSEKRVRGVALELAAVDVEATPPPSPEAVVTAREIPPLPTGTTKTPTVWDEFSSQEPLGAYGEWAKAPVAP